MNILDVRRQLLLQVALNGARDHPRVPRTARELADAARTSVEAGAKVVHVHAFDDDGRESLAAEPCAAALRAVRAACPGIPVSLSTSAAIEPDPDRRLELVSGWTLLPELVTANQGEPGIAELCEQLMARGVGIEAGLLSLADAEAFVGSGLAERCVRVLLEPLDFDPQEAVAHAAAMEEVVLAAGIGLEQVHHGDGIASWAVSERGLRRGHGIRTGLEDTAVLPDGRVADDNAALVRVAAGMIARQAERAMTIQRELITHLRNVFDSWERLLSGMSEDEVSVPLAPGKWSIGEVITHLWAWQQISIARVEAARLNTSPNYPAWLGDADPFHAEDHVDEFNARIQETHRGQSWPIRYRNWREGFLRLLELAEDLESIDTRRHAWLRGYALSAVLEGSYQHHQEHLDRLLARGGES